MKIYNSLTRKKEEFVPLKPSKVGMYVCGPTVYDEPHIGHARSAYIFDVIRRYFKYKSLEVTFVRNVTDVDDKIIDKARKEFPGEDLNEAVKKVAKKYFDSYHEAMSALGIGKPDKEPKATEYIPKMIKFIELLIKKGVAYEAGGDVYFDIKKAKDYGRLSHQSVDKMEIGARIPAGEKKKDALDFALWKAAKEGEPSWPSPWGNGRPGWHIECSVMSSDILGDEFDIHGGGLDLIFPHHENEVAQSEGAGKKFARFWMHNGLLTIKGEKMAKSLGNFISIEDFLERYKNPEILKMFFLSANYSHPIDYTDDKIKEAEAALRSFRMFLIYLIDRYEQVKRLHPNFAEDAQLISSEKFRAKIDSYKSEFIQAMDDDFNLPAALAALFKMRDYSWMFALPLRVEIEDLKYAKSAMIELGNIFGLFLDEECNRIDAGLKLYIEDRIAERDAARRSRDYKKADLIRDELIAKDIILEDTKEGTVWRRRI